MKKAFLDKNWDDFIDLCTRVKSAEEFHQLFDLFLTIEEKEMLASRYLIVKALLDAKMTQREIAKANRVSIAQITRGSNALKITPHTLKNFLKIS